jgi:hypothetical protein
VRGTTSKAVIFDYTPPTLGLYGVAGNNYITASEKPAALITGLSDAVGRTVTLRIDGTVVGTVQPSGQWKAQNSDSGQKVRGPSCHSRAGLASTK